MKCSWLVFFLSITIHCFFLPNVSYAAPQVYGQPPIRLSYFDHSKQDHLVFLVFGDSGTGDAHQYQVGEAMYSVCQQLGCEFAIGLGDNIYESGVNSVFKNKLWTHFEKPYQKFGRFDFWMISGNHDWKKSMRAQVEYSHFSPRWRMPYYHYEIPGLPSWVHMYGFDTTKIDEAQALIARKTLCRRDKSWNFIFGHHPMYSNGKHGNSKTIQKALLGIIEDCGVQVYFAGHDHHQEHITAKHFEQIIQGAAGKTRAVSHRDYHPGDETRQNYIVQAYGFGVVDLTPKQINVKFFNDQGQQLYSWTASKNEIGIP